MAATVLSTSETVCVTGANGFIGSWIVRTLLAHGYTVHAAYQPGTPTDHLLQLESADARLRLFPADLLDQSALRAAVAGCAGVFHVASPCTLDPPKDPEAELIRPAVEGTINVLAAAVAAAGVRRVVITASISSLIPNPGWPHHEKPVDESSWTDMDYCKTHKAWYPLSKTMAEKAGREFAEKHGLDVVTVHPSTCLGPLLQPGLNASSAVLLNLLKGSDDTQGDCWLGCVHVRDVAEVHVLLYETPTASGRYLCTNGIYQFKDFAKNVAELYPHYPVHRFSGDTQPGLREWKNAATRLTSLGFEFTPLEDTLEDAVKSLRDNGLLDY